MLNRKETQSQREGDGSSAHVTVKAMDCSVLVLQVSHFPLQIIRKNRREEKNVKMFLKKKKDRLHHLGIKGHRLCPAAFSYSKDTKSFGKFLEDS